MAELTYQQMQAGDAFTKAVNSGMGLSASQKAGQTAVAKASGATNQIIQNPLTGEKRYSSGESAVPTFLNAKVLGTVDTPTTPKVSQTVQSNANVIENSLPIVGSRMQAIGTKGVTKGADGISRYADGTEVPGQTNAEGTGGKDQTFSSETPDLTNFGIDTGHAPIAGVSKQITDSRGNVYEVDSNGQITSGPSSGEYMVGANISKYPQALSSVTGKDINEIEADNRLNEITTTINNLKAGAESTLATQLSSIQQKFDARRAQMAEINRRQGSSLMNTLIMGGSNASASSGMIIGDMERYGIQQLANLDSQENDAILAAQNAFDTKNYELADKLLTEAETIRKEKQKKADDIATTATERNRQMTVDSAIGDIMNKGITDPAQILSELSKMGVDATSEDVSKTLDNLTKLTDKAKTNSSNQNIWAKLAMDGGQADIASQISALDPTSPTFSADMAKLQSQIKGDDLDKQYKRLQIAKLAQDISGAGSGNGIALPQDYSSLLSSRTPEQITNFNNIPEKDKSAVAQLISGDALLTDLVKSRGAAGTADINRYIEEATSVDPNFSVNNNKIKYNFLQQWNNPNGKSSIMKNSINTSLGHLADFKTSADALDSKSLKFMNSVNNILSTETGDPKVLAVRTDIGALASEIATIYKNGVSPSETEIEDWRKVLAADFSKKQFQGVADEISKLLTSKITATRYQYKSTMGYELDQPIIDPDKRQALIDAGITPDVIATEKVPGVMTANELLNHTIPGQNTTVENTGGYTPDFWTNAQ